MTVSPELTALLQELVRIPSPNPPGDSAEIAAFIAERLRTGGLSVRMHAPPEKPQAPSVIATLGHGDPVILLHAHIDTVPVAADESTRWTSDPYAAEIRDGRLYGKGSVDDKAPLAAMIHAGLELAASNRPINGTLVIVAAAEEETGGQLGTKWLADSGLIPASDFIIVGEQTHNRAATAHKGVLRATVRATGKSVHATNPNRGVNAITAMARAVLALDSYHRLLAERVHPLAGSPTCNVGVIQGGSTANAVPDLCQAWLDRRMIPGEDSGAVKEELIGVISGVDAGAAILSVGDFQISNWFESTTTGELATQFLSAVHEILQVDPGPIGYLPGSDAKHLMNVARGEIVIFGPGSYEVAHAYDETVDLVELGDTYAILMTFLHSVLASPR